jgi:hypothetical protein
VMLGVVDDDQVVWIDHEQVCSLAVLPVLCHFLFPFLCAPRGRVCEKTFYYMTIFSRAQHFR